MTCLREADAASLIEEAVDNGAALIGGCFDPPRPGDRLRPPPHSASHTLRG